MSEKRSFPFRIAAKHQDDEKMSIAIQEELYQIVHRAAEPVRAGETVKAQINRSRINLGNPPLWRVLSAWYRDGSSSWSAAAAVDFQNRFLKWRDAQDRRSADALATERVRQAASRRAALEQSRLDHLAALATIESRLALFGGSDHLD